MDDWRLLLGVALVAAHAGWAGWLLGRAWERDRRRYRWRFASSSYARMLLYWDIPFYPRRLACRAGGRLLRRPYALRG